MYTSIHTRGGVIAAAVPRHQVILRDRVRSVPIRGGNNIGGKHLRLLSPNTEPILVPDAHRARFKLNNGLCFDLGIVDAGSYFRGPDGTVHGCSCLVSALWFNTLMRFSASANAQLLADVGQLLQTVAASKDLRDSGGYISTDDRGGASTPPFWLQILCDTLQVRVVTYACNGPRGRCNGVGQECYLNSGFVYMPSDGIVPRYTFYIATVDRSHWVVLCDAEGGSNMPPAMVQAVERVLRGEVQADYLLQQPEEYTDDPDLLAYALKVSEEEEPPRQQQQHDPELAAALEESAKESSNKQQQLLAGALASALAAAANDLGGLLDKADGLQKEAGAKTGDLNAGKTDDRGVRVLIREMSTHEERLREHRKRAAATTAEERKVLHMSQLATRDARKQLEAALSAYQLRRML